MTTQNFELDADPNACPVDTLLHSDRPVEAEISFGAEEDEVSAPIEAVEAASDGWFDDPMNFEPCGEDSDRQGESLVDSPAGGFITRSRRRQEFYPNPQTIYEALVHYGLLRKMSDIVLAETKFPWHLRQEAVQEMETGWSRIKYKPEFGKNQVANYAYLSGIHAARSLQRELGAICRIPGALFRSKKPHAFLQSIGAATNPRSVEDYANCLELSADPYHNGDVVQQAALLDESFLAKRLAGLCLSDEQRALMHAILLESKTAEAAAADLGIPFERARRWVHSITRQLTDRNNRFDKRMEERQKHLGPRLH